MTDEQVTLRTPFKPEQIGKLPRSTCKDCADWKKNCTKHSKSRCSDCGAWIGPHIHLDYVGHAAVTDRLLTVDPKWSWEPVAYADNGLPLITNNDTEAELWIRLTVDGVTRLGVGTCTKGSFEQSKQLISDALRNAAMRFGVALDLWSKEDLHTDDETPSGSPDAAPSPITAQPGLERLASDDRVKALRARLSGDKQATKWVSDQRFGVWTDAVCDRIEEFLSARPTGETGEEPF